MRDDELKTYANEKIVANRDREKAMTKNDPINKKDPPKQPVMKLLNIKESPTKETTLEQDLMEYLSIKQDRLDTTEDMLNTIEDVDDYFLK